MKLVEIILGEMENVNKAQKNFIIILMKTMMIIYGKINFSSLARYSGLSEKTFRRWFKKPFDFIEFNAKAIARVIRPVDEAIAAFDPSFINKSGSSTWGKDFFWNGCAARAERGLELISCAIISVAHNTAYALATDQTPLLKKRSERDKDDPSRIDIYLNFIKKLSTTIKKYTNFFVCDGFFAKKTFVDGIVEMGFSFIGKLRCDVDLKMIYTSAQKAGPGRPKKFAGKCDMSKLQGFEFAAKFDEEIDLFSGIFYQPALQRTIKVVVAQRTNKNRIGTMFLFSTDLCIDPVKIFIYYKARFQIEFVFRDAKQHVGLADCQSRNKESLWFHQNVSCAVLNLIKIQDFFDRTIDEKNKSFSISSYKVRYHNKNMIESFFHKLGFGLTSEKLIPVFQQMLNYGAIQFRKG